MSRSRGVLTAVLIVGVCFAALPGCAVLSDPKPVCTDQTKQHVLDLLNAVQTPASATAVETTAVQCGDSAPSVHAALVFAVTGEEATVVANLRAQIGASGWTAATPTVALATYRRTENRQMYWATIEHDPSAGGQLILEVTAGDSPW